MEHSSPLAFDSWRRGLLLAALAIAVACAWLRPLDHFADAQAQAGFKRAVASFATARALNAVISLVQGTEFSVQPLGIGVTLTPGQMLDPLNDLVERFSDLMLAASVAFGAQILLIEMGIHWAMSFVLSLAAALWAWLWLRGQGPPALLSRVLVALLLVRFIVPLAGLTSELVYRGFMQEQYAASQSGIEKASQTLSTLAPADGVTDQKWWQLHKQIEKLGATIDQAVEHAIRLIVVFLLQTLLLPLVVFWILLRTGRMLVTPP